MNSASHEWLNSNPEVTKKIPKKEFVAPDISEKLTSGVLINLRTDGMIDRAGRVKKNHHYRTLWKATGKFWHWKKTYFDKR